MPNKNFLQKLTSCSAWGALTTYAYKLHPKKFSAPWLHPMATCTRMIVIPWSPMWCGPKKK